MPSKKCRKGKSGLTMIKTEKNCGRKQNRRLAVKVKIGDHCFSFCSYLFASLESVGGKSCID